VRKNTGRNERELKIFLDKAEKRLYLKLDNCSYTYIEEISTLGAEYLGRADSML